MQTFLDDEGILSSKKQPRRVPTQGDQEQYATKYQFVAKTNKNLWLNHYGRYLKFKRILCGNKLNHGITPPPSNLASPVGHFFNVFQGSLHVKVFRLPQNINDE